MAHSAIATPTLKTIAVTGHSEGPKRTRIDGDTGTFYIGTDGSPLEHLLGSLAACINVIGHLVARERDLELSAFHVDVEGDIDPAKYAGKDQTPRAGFQGIRVSVAVETNADDAAVDAWLEAVADRCPVADNLRGGVSIDLERA